MLKAAHKKHYISFKRVRYSLENTNSLQLILNLKLPWKYKAKSRMQKVCKKPLEKN